MTAGHGCPLARVEALVLGGAPLECRCPDGDWHEARVAAAVRERDADAVWPVWVWVPVVAGVAALARRLRRR